MFYTEHIIGHYRALTFENLPGAIIVNPKP
jgi:hypothetical protein